MTLAKGEGKSGEWENTRRYKRERGNGGVLFMKVESYSLPLLRPGRGCAPHISAHWLGLTLSRCSEIQLRGSELTRTLNNLLAQHFVATHLGGSAG